MKLVTYSIVCIFLLSCVGAAAGGKWPWRRRVNANVETFHITAHKNTPIELWPAEPDTPGAVERADFAGALGQLCTETSRPRVEKYAGWILDDAAVWEVDPFLLASLIYDQSQCRPVAMKRYQERGLYGLTHLPVAMHAHQSKKNIYTYYTRGETGFVANEMDLMYPMNRYKASKARSNVTMSAALMRVFALQRDMLVEEFPGKPSRHYISNWFYGDRVRTPEPENRVLTARRRMIDYYHGKQVASVATHAGVQLVSPLDGSPRLVIDYFGNKRGRKDGYGHRGIDIDGAIGEPVRAVADGRVVFAGMDLPGVKQNKRLTVAEGKAMEPTDLPQGGGFYVAINHGNNFGSVYMHLHSFDVEYNQRVKAGDVIGTLGQSGSKKSGPHLHLEFREEEHRIDPAAPLAPVLVNPFLR